MWGKPVDMGEICHCGGKPVDVVKKHVDIVD
jgi:hypothetical protein